ncbi:hypothetical protein E2C01_037881 [Portunus trituberculatus]|uniref:Secreted protein n=1 Tax=Portunus trituberculatus TaxID=210409 RepID=A0A5B7FF89_PORTR|nr:hypothetical protein [Portunus trituberculatus]
MMASKVRTAKQLLSFVLLALSFKKVLSTSAVFCGKEVTDWPVSPTPYIRLKSPTVGDFPYKWQPCHATSGGVIGKT